MIRRSWRLPLQHQVNCAPWRTPINFLFYTHDSRHGIKALLRLPSDTYRRVYFSQPRANVSLLSSGIYKSRVHPTILPFCSSTRPSILFLPEMTSKRSHSTRDSDKHPQETDNSAMKHRKPSRNGDSDCKQHDTHELEHDHSHSHSHSHSIFGHSHSHGEEGHSHDAEQIIAALKGSGVYKLPHGQAHLISRGVRQYRR